MRRIFLILFFSLMPVAVVFAAAAAINADTKKDEQSRRLWNLQDVDIRTVIEQVARETGKSFIIDPAVNGKATIVSNKELNADELYQVFLSVLQVLGFAAIPSGDVIKIVPDNNAKHLALPFAGAGQGPDNLVVSVVPVSHVGVAALVPVLRNLVSQQGHLAAYAPSNVIIIADREENVERLTEIIHRIDREETDGAEVVLLEHATASEVVASLNTIVTANRGGANAGGTGPVALAADDRSNTVIISGDKNQRLKLRALVAQLDVPRNEMGNTEVIALEYQRAEDLVPVLGNVLTSYFGTTVGGSNAPVSTATASRLNANSNRTAATQSSTSSSSGGNYGGGDGFNGFQSPERQAIGTVVGPYGVQAEPNTNSLIITAPPSLMRNLKSVIARLDVRRAQVLVEAVIAEVNADRTNEFGIEWNGGGSLIGGQNWGADGLLNEYQTIIDADGNEAPINPGTGLTVGVIHEGSIRFLLHALTADTTANVLSTPSVIAMDNSEATISVGETIPYETGSYTTSTTGAGSEGPYSTFDYREVGIQLVIKPQISKGDTIQLDIMQRADNILNADTAQPTTNNRMITTRVMVDSGDILVLGGLIESAENDVVQKVPILGDIPILGKAFSNTKTETTKTNLMVFIRTSVMRDAMESNRITNEKYNYVRDQQILGELDLPPDPRETDFLPWKGDSPEGLPLPLPFD